MIIDWILDRKNLEADLKQSNESITEYTEWYESLDEQQKVFAQKPYNAHDFYIYAMEEEADDITRAMDEGEEDDVKAALCEYIIFNGYNPQICEYINSVEWIGEE